MHQNPSNRYNLLHEGNPTIREAGPVRVLPEPLERMEDMCIVWEATGRMKAFDYDKAKFSYDLTEVNNEIAFILDFIKEKIVFKGSNLVQLFLLFWKQTPPQILLVKDARYLIDLAPDEYYLTDAIVEK